MEPTPEPAAAPPPTSPLLALTERSLRSAPPDKEGFVSPRAAGAFDLVVGPASVDHALEALRLLLDQAGPAGFRIKVDPTTRRTVIRVGEQDLEIRIRERRRQIEHRLTAEERRRYPTKEARRFMLPRWDYLPSGELSLQVDAPAAHRVIRRSWSLGGTSRLPGQIAKCLSGLPKIVEAQRQAAIDRERQEREWAEQRRRDAEAEYQRQQERHRRELLFQEAAAWQQCQTLRGYIDAMRQRFIPQRDPALRSKLEEWMKWANSVADSVDPVLQPQQQSVVSLGS